MHSLHAFGEPRKPGDKTDLVESNYSYASKVLVAKISPHNNRTQPTSQTRSKIGHEAIKNGVLWVNGKSCDQYFV
jgi:hypothetical protein